ncbi:MULTISPECIES: hypothetical protein [unclassified Streptomyces]|uniref:hypothetical protein n=1 Tax=unclassified Streptomyces TaxID=2593676 RepID=UPI00381BC037
MTSSRTRPLAGLAAGLFGTALLAFAGSVQPAGAATSPDAVFYTGAGRSGSAMTADLGSTACQALPRPALSAQNLSGTDIAVYYNPGCRPGIPGSSGDTVFVLGSLHTAGFAFPALSYRVLDR